MAGLFFGLQFVIHVSVATFFRSTFLPFPVSVKAKWIMPVVRTAPCQCLTPGALDHIVRMDSPRLLAPLLNEPDA